MMIPELSSLFKRNECPEEKIAAPLGSKNSAPQPLPTEAEQRAAEKLLEQSRQFIKDYALPSIHRWLTFPKGNDSPPKSPTPQSADRSSDDSKISKPSPKKPAMVAAAAVLVLGLAKGWIFGKSAGGTILAGAGSSASGGGGLVLVGTGAIAAAPHAAGALTLAGLSVGALGLGLIATVGISALAGLGIDSIPLGNLPVLSPGTSIENPTAPQEASRPDNQDKIPSEEEEKILCIKNFASAEFGIMLGDDLKIDGFDLSFLCRNSLTVLQLDLSRHSSKLNRMMVILQEMQSWSPISESQKRSLKKMIFTSVLRECQEAHGEHYCEPRESLRVKLGRAMLCYQKAQHIYDNLKSKNWAVSLFSPNKRESTLLSCIQLGKSVYESQQDVVDAMQNLNWLMERSQGLGFSDSELHDFLWTALLSNQPDVSSFLSQIKMHIVFSMVEQSQTYDWISHPDFNRLLADFLRADLSFFETQTSYEKLIGYIRFFSVAAVFENEDIEGFRLPMDQLNENDLEVLQYLIRNSSATFHQLRREAIAVKACIADHDNEQLIKMGWLNYLPDPLYILITALREMGYSQSLQDINSTIHQVFDLGLRYSHNGGVN